MIAHVTYGYCTGVDLKSQNCYEALWKGSQDIVPLENSIQSTSRQRKVRNFYTKTSSQGSAFRTSNWQPGEVLPTSVTQTSIPLNEFSDNDSIDDDPGLYDEQHQEQYEQQFSWEDIYIYKFTFFLLNFVKFHEGLNKLSELVWAVENAVQNLGATTHKHLIRKFLVISKYRK